MANGKTKELTQEEFEKAMELLEDVDRATALRPPTQRHARRRALESVVQAKQLRASQVVSRRRSDTRRSIETLVAHARDYAAGVPREDHGSLA